MKKLLITLSAVALASVLTFAEDAPPNPPPPGGPGGGPGGPGGKRPPPEEIFKKLDTNNDGFLSLEEFKASPRGQKDPAKAEEVFKQMDTNGDGKVSLDEFKAHRPPGGPGGPGGRKGRGQNKGSGDGANKTSA